MTSTATVGSPRESRISRPRIISIVVSGITFSHVSELPVRDRGDAGQSLSLDELERGAAPGRDMRHLAGEAELLDRLHRLAAADDRHRAARREELRDALRAGRERWDLEDADRSVPEDGLRATDLVRVVLRRVRTDVDDRHIVGHVVHALDRRAARPGLVN